MISHFSIIFSQFFPLIPASSHDFPQFPSFSRYLPLPKRTRWRRERLNGDRRRFDIECCERGHHGEAVSFNSHFEEIQVERSGPFVAWGNVLHSHPSKLHPAGEGLGWLAFGFGADGLTHHKILRQSSSFDALYGKCRRQAATTNSF